MIEWLKAIAIGSFIGGSLALAVLIPIKACADTLKAQRTIEKHIEYMLADDVLGTWSLASKRVQTAFNDPDRLFNMAKRNYEPLHRPGNYAFGRSLQQGHGELVIQEVMVTGPEGRSWRAVFYLVLEDGMYKIKSIKLSKMRGGTL